MSREKGTQAAALLPFVVGTDGRVYISEALISTSTITKFNFAGQPRAAS